MTRSEKAMRFTFKTTNGSVVRETSARNPWRSMVVLASELTPEEVQTLGLQAGDEIDVDLTETIEVHKRARGKVEMRPRVHKVSGFVKVREAT